MYCLELCSPLPPLSLEYAGGDTGCPRPVRHASLTWRPQNNARPPGSWWSSTEMTKYGTLAAAKPSVTVESHKIIIVHKMGPYPTSLPHNTNSRFRPVQNAQAP